MKRNVHLITNYLIPCYLLLVLKFVIEALKLMLRMKRPNVYLLFEMDIFFEKVLFPLSTDIVKDVHLNQLLLLRFAWLKHMWVQNQVKHITKNWFWPLPLILRCKSWYCSLLVRVCYGQLLATKRCLLLIITSEDEESLRLRYRYQIGWFSARFNYTTSSSFPISFEK